MDCLEDTAHHQPEGHRLSAVHYQLLCQHLHILHQNSHHILDEQSGLPVLLPGPLPLLCLLQSRTPLCQHVEFVGVQNSRRQGHLQEKEEGLEIFLNGSFRRSG